MGSLKELYNAIFEVVLPKKKKKKERGIIKEEKKTLTSWNF